MTFFRRGLWGRRPRIRGLEVVRREKNRKEKVRKGKRKKEIKATVECIMYGGGIG